MNAPRPRPIQPSTTVAETLARIPSAAQVFLKRRMSCVGCAIAPFETLAEVCSVYDVSIDQLLDELTAVQQ